MIFKNGECVLFIRREVVEGFLTILVVTMLADSLHSMYVFGTESKTETESVPLIKDPTPGYWETSEYMIGTIATDVIFLESNGTIDPDTEDWTQFEMSNVMRKIKSALDWWEGQAPFVRFMPLPPPPPGGYIPVPTSYEPINRNVSDRGLWVSEAMSYLGYTTGDNITQVRNYVNDLRDSTGADWAFIMFIVDSSNDPDGETPDGYSAYACNIGQLYLVMTYDNDGWGIKDMDRVCAHEIAHMFWATDEYNNVTEYCGYLNAVDIEGSGGLMEVNDWSLSGAPHGLNGTWGQIGWRDSDSDGIPDIVDTFPEIVLKSDSTNPTTNTTITFTGTTFVVPYPNMNPYTWNPVEYRNVTINKIEMIEFRIDSGDWSPVHNVSGSLGTDPIENFTFYTPQLSLGNHTIEVRATNQWDNCGYVNTTITILEFPPTDLNQDGTVNIIDLSTVAYSFGTKAGDENYNQIADLDGNEEINVIDLSIVAMDCGKTV